jgi:uncharacterized protein (DUF305 family)
MGLTPRDAAVIVTVLLATAGVLSCRSAPAASAPRVVQPGAPGEASRVVARAPAVAIAFTPADVRFMQGMIGHHAQALEMTALLSARTSRDDMRLLARRIDISQADEIRMMQAWLKARGQDVPSEHAHHAPGATLMPGMLTADQMARLSAANGALFDRLFLEFMIKHHEGALVMVKELLAEAGAGQQSEIFAFASDVEADQTMEIDRMRAMLMSMGKTRIAR